MWASHPHELLACDTKERCAYRNENLHSSSVKLIDGRTHPWQPPWHGFKQVKLTSIVCADVGVGSAPTRIIIMAVTLDLISLESAQADRTATALTAT